CARLQDYQTGGVAVAAHPDERPPTSRAAVVGGRTSHLVVAQCRRHGRGDDPGQYAAAAARCRGSAPPPAPGDPAAVGQCVSAGVDGHLGRLARPPTLVDWSLCPRAVASYRGPRKETGSDTRSASCCMKKPTPERAGPLPPHRPFLAGRLARSGPQGLKPFFLHGRALLEETSDALPRVGGP